MYYYRYHIEIQVPEYDDFECSNCDTYAEALAWKQEAERRWPGLTAVITENK